MSWDIVISVVIIGALILTIWAKASHMTIPELFADIMDRFRDGADDTVEGVRQISF